MILLFGGIVTLVIASLATTIVYCFIDTGVDMLNTVICGTVFVVIVAVGLFLSSYFQGLF